MRSDLPAISLILDDTGLFPNEMLEAMVEPFFEEPEQSERWLVYDDQELGAVGFGYRRLRCACGYTESIVTPCPRNRPYTGPHMPKFLLTDDSWAASKQPESKP